MSDPSAPATVSVLARANLTLEGGIQLTVFQSATVPNTPETQACIAQGLLVEAGPDGLFPDVGPVGERMRTEIFGCCGRKPTASG